MDFIESSEKLKFAYKIHFETKEKKYFKDVQIQSLSKSEKQENGIISESIVFDCLSLWYEENTVIYKIEQTTNEIRWGFRWDSRFKDYNIRNITYRNQGHVEAPILVEIDGAVTNPKIEIYIEKELYQRVPMKTIINQYEKLKYSSKENEFYIKRIKEDGTEESLFDLDVLDFYNDNVVRLPKNYYCEIRLVADNPILNAKVTIISQYKAV